MPDFRRLLILLLGLFIGAPALAQFQTLETGAIGFATFNSNVQKVARNKHGVLASYLTTRNAGYTAQQFVLKLTPPGGSPVTILSETHATNPPCIDASETGEFFVVFPDWTTHQLHAYVWRDIGANPAPEKLSLALHGDGKFACVFDEARRTLHYVGLSGTLVRWRVDHGVFHTRRLWLDNVHIAQYPSLTLSTDGVLHAFWNTLTFTGPSYRGVQYITSPDGGETWWNYWHPVGTSNLPLPSPAPPVASDEFGSSFRLTRDEDHGANAFLLTAFADSTQIAAIWSFVPGYAEPCFVSQKRCSSVFMRYQRKDRARDQIAPIMLGAHVLRPLGGGALLKRSGQLYFITTEVGELVLARLDGDRMTEIKRVAIPGTGASRCPFELSAFRGRESDDDIIGTFTHLNVSCADWSTMPDNSGVTSDVVAFRLTIAP